MGARLAIAQAPDVAAAPAPVTGWRRMVGDSLAVSGAAAVCHALAVVTSLLMRMALDPAQMGVWQGLKLFLSYANYANLGVSKGAAREFTVALGRRDTAAAERGLNLAFTVNTLSSLVYAGCLAAAGVWVAVRGDGLWRDFWGCGLVVLGGLVVVQRHITFHVTILRCCQAFAVTSQLSVLEALLTLFLAGMAAWLWGLYGLYAGTLLVMIGSLVFLKRNGRARLRWAWDTREIRRLICLGGPILLAGMVATLFRSLDKLMILGYLSDREFQLGCYSLALLVGGQLYGLANMLSLVMGPRYAELYGATGNRRAVALLAARASEFQAAALALLGGLALVAAAPVLGRMLPDYQPGLAPAAWLVPGAVALGLSLPANQYLVAVYRERRALAALVLATALAALGNHVVLTRGYGLTGVAAATSVGYIAYYLLLVAVSFWPELDRRARTRYLASLALALGPTLTLAAIWQGLLPSTPTDWTAAAAKGLAVIALWAGTIGFGWRYGGWSAAWRQEPRR